MSFPIFLPNHGHKITIGIPAKPTKSLHGHASATKLTTSGPNTNPEDLGHLDWDGNVHEPDGTWWDPLDAQLKQKHGKKQPHSFVHISGDGPSV
jgi:hypothetical protein